MGQKTNPIGMRLGIIKTWDSRWFARKDYAKLLEEDLFIRKYLKKRLSQAGISRIIIQRAVSKVTINISTARPGLVIGNLLPESVVSSIPAASRCEAVRSRRKVAPSTASAATTSVSSMPFTRLRPHCRIFRIARWVGDACAVPIIDVTGTSGSSANSSSFTDW